MTIRLVAMCAAFFLGGAGMSLVRAAGNTWYQTQNTNTTEIYGTNFDAQGAMWYDPFDWGVYVWRIYLRMNVWSGKLDCDVNRVWNGAYDSGRIPWYNAPFPLDYYNTPAWDYWTHDRYLTYQVEFTYAASQYEICQPGHVGAAGWRWWANGVGSFSSLIGWW